MTREEFVKQRCEIDKITEEEFEKKYRIVDCNCGEYYCKGYKCLDLDGLLKENQELKKQVEDMTLCRDIASGHREEVQDRENILLSQQKVFIKYLENEIERKRLNATCTTEYNDYVVPLKHVLQKFKEITGVSDDKTN